MRRFLYLVMILLFTLPSYAQDAPSETLAILFDHTAEHLILINTEGNESIIELGIPQNIFNVWGRITISSDGRYAAFCWSLEPNIPNQIYHLNVLELATGSIILEKEFGNLHVCDATAFNIDGTQLAVSTIDDFGWMLEIYDFASGTVLHILNNHQDVADTLAEVAPFLGDIVYIRAEVEYFNDDTLIFSAIPFIAMGSMNAVPAFEWTISDDTLTLREHVGNLFGDTDFIHNETVYPTLNDDFDFSLSGGQYGLANEVHIWDGQNDRLIYRNTDDAIIQSRFISNAEYVALHLHQPENGIVILSRDGSIISQNIIASNSYVYIENNPDGGIILWKEIIDDMSIHHLQLLYPDGTRHNIWTLHTDEEGSSRSIELVWVAPIPLD